MIINRFEIDGPSRFLPMEGIRAIAVFMVFCQHYTRQFFIYGNLSPDLKPIAANISTMGNFGVELFFILSGFLIYGMLMRRRPSVIPFMTRRAVRLYPAFLVALAIGISQDFFRSEPRIPQEWGEGFAYLFAQVAFLPGLFDISSLFAVNWSLSYEWWFYFSCVILYGSLGLSNISLRLRIALIAFFVVALSVCAILISDGVPIRGASLLFGMLLYELRDLPPTRSGNERIPPRLMAHILSIVGILAFVFALSLTWTTPFEGWLKSVVLAFCFMTFVFCALYENSFLGKILSLRWLRYFGNMSYSYYLVHGFAVVIPLRLFVFPMIEQYGWSEAAFLLLWVPIFIGTLVVGGALYLLVEEPYSIRSKK